MTQQSGGSAAGFPVSGVLAGSLPSPTFATNGTTPILGSVSVALAADITNSATGSMITLLTLPISTGTWLLFGCVYFQNTAAGASWLSVRIYDGTNPASEGAADLPAGLFTSIPLLGTYVAAAPVSLLVQGQFASATNLVRSTSGLSGSVHDVTFLTALRTA